MFPFLKLGGRAILQRGEVSGQEREALQDALLVLGGRIAEERQAGAGRQIIVAEKVAMTPGRFPRRAGIPEKRPLGWRPFHGKLPGETEERGSGNLP